MFHKTKKTSRINICYMGLAAGDYGGASRSLCIILRKINRARFQPFVLFTKTGPILPELTRLSIPYKVWGDTEMRGFISYGLDVCKAAWFFLVNRIHLLHVNYVPWRPATLVAARLLGIPVVLHFRVVQDELSPSLKYASLVIANSQYTGNASVKTKVPCKVMYNAVEINRYKNAKDVRSEFGAEPKDVVITFAGQIREIKGIDTFIAVAHQLKNEGVKFWIAGECRDPGVFESAYTEEMLREKIGDNENIIYLGYQSDIQNIYQSSDVVIIPSKWEEPFGLVNIEAGACAKPVVATKVGGIPEIITHGENGFLVDKNDVNAMAYYVSMLVKDPDLREIMGKKARQTVERRFTDSPIRELEAIYEGVLKNTQAD